MSQNQRLDGKQDAGARTPTGLRTHHNGHALWRIRDLRFRSRFFCVCVRGVSLPHASAAFPNAHGCCLHLVGFVRAWLCCQKRKGKNRKEERAFRTECHWAIEFPRSVATLCCVAVRICLKPHFSELLVSSPLSAATCVFCFLCISIGYIRVLI